jgi:hypothetical protein
VAEAAQRIRYNFGTTGGEISGEKTCKRPLSKAFRICVFFVRRHTLYPTELRARRFLLFFATSRRLCSPFLRFDPTVVKRIEDQQKAIGVQFAFEDLLIGATALHLGYEVATLNLMSSVMFYCKKT